jgi:hypothetical protein
MRKVLEGSGRSLIYVLCRQLFGGSVPNEIRTADPPPPFPNMCVQRSVSVRDKLFRATSMYGVASLCCVYRN